MLCTLHYIPSYHVHCGVESRHAIGPVRVVLYCTHVQDRITRMEDRWLEYCGGGRGGIPPFPVKRSPAHRWPPVLLCIPSPFFLHGGISLKRLKADYRAYSSMETVFTYCVIRNPLRLIGSLGWSRLQHTLLQPTT